MIRFLTAILSLFPLLVSGQNSLGNLLWTPSGLASQFRASAFDYTGITDALVVLTWDSITNEVAGSDVPWLEDLTGNGNNLTNIITGSNPQYIPAELNGKAVLRFDGSSWMRNSFDPGITNGQPSTIFCVAKATNTAATIYLYEGMNSANRNAIFVSGGTLSIYAGATLNSFTPQTDEWYVLTSVYNGANSYQRTNGVASAAGDASGQGVYPVTLGARYDMASPWRGDIAAYILVDGIVETNEMQAIEAALMSDLSIP